MKNLIFAALTMITVHSYAELSCQATTRENSYDIKVDTQRKMAEVAYGPRYGGGTGDVIILENAFYRPGEDRVTYSSRKNQYKLVVETIAGDLQATLHDGQMRKDLFTTMCHQSEPVLQQPTDKEISCFPTNEIYLGGTLVVHVDGYNRLVSAAIVGGGAYGYFLADQNLKSFANTSSQLAMMVENKQLGDFFNISYDWITGNGVATVRANNGPYGANLQIPANKFVTAPVQCQISEFDPNSREGE